MVNVKMALPPSGSSVCSGCEMMPFVKTSGAVTVAADAGSVTTGAATALVGAVSGAAFVLVSCAVNGTTRPQARSRGRMVFMRQLLASTTDSAITFSPEQGH